VKSLTLVIRSSSASMIVVLLPELEVNITLEVSAHPEPITKFSGVMPVWTTSPPCTWGPFWQPDWNGPAVSILLLGANAVPWLPFLSKAATNA